MTVNCVWEHNGDDSLLYAIDFVGAYTRGECLSVALGKMPAEIRAYARWAGILITEPILLTVVEERVSELAVRDADSDVLWKEEREPLTPAAYEALKALTLKSALDLEALYSSVPDKEASTLPKRRSFYGPVPRTAEEMYRHVRSVNSYYFAEIGVEADNEGSVYDCRLRGFETLESDPHFLDRPVCDGSYGEEWSLRKVLRRFLWHDRIHARAMVRMAVRTFGPQAVNDPFDFEVFIL